ncbi:MAG: hypothetical protein LQ349_009082 [Xanthoria aureola]|nr:MAG: hypothetical protein LQ349_009082 [Xanthoria aureola]
MTKGGQQPDAKRQKMDNDDDHNRIDSHENNHSLSKVKTENPVMPSSEYTTFIKLTVGPEKQTFYAYKERLCRKSDFFKAACHDAFQESQGAVDLPEQDPSIVEYFIHWICTGQLRGLYVPTATISSLERAAAAANADLSLFRISRDHTYRKKWAEKQQALDLANYRDLPLQHLVSLYTFADFAQVKGLKDAIVDAVVEAYGNPEAALSRKPDCFWNLVADRPDWLEDPIGLINSFWQKLPADDGFGRVLVNLFADAVSPASGTSKHEQCGIRYGGPAPTLDCDSTTE